MANQDNTVLTRRNKMTKKEKEARRILAILNAIITNDKVAFDKLTKPTKS